MSLAKHLSSFVVVALGASAGCASLRPPPPPPPQEIVVRVSAGGREPLAGVAIKPSAGREAITDAKGIAHLEIQGAEGTKVDLVVVCPAGYAAPANLTRVTVRRASRVPEFDIPCKGYEHAVLIAFKTTGATGIPILYLGSEIARTDASGHALVELEPRVGETLEFKLDTSDPKLKFLRPQNPERSIRVPDGDEAFTVEQKFVEDKPKPVQVATKKAQRPVDISRPQ